MKYWVGRMQRDSETVQWCMTTRGLIKAIRAFEDEVKTWGWVSNQSFALTYQETGEDKWEDAIWYDNYVVCGSVAAEKVDGRWRMVAKANVAQVAAQARAWKLRDDEEHARWEREEEEYWTQAMDAYEAAYLAEEARMERVMIAAMTKGCV